MKQPLVSVLLPVFNGEQFLQETLDSIASQDLANFEVIIVDDGSSDNSNSIIENWIEQQSLSVTHLSKPTNYGVCAALRDAGEKAKGKYFAQIGHDDVWETDHLSSLVKILEENDEVSAAFAGLVYIDENGTQYSEDIFQHQLIKELDHVSFVARLFRGNFLCAPGSLFRASLYDQSYWGAANERLQDYEMWIFMAFLGEFRFSEKQTISYRIHRNNLSSGGTMQKQSQYELWQVVARTLSSTHFLDFYKSIDEPTKRLDFLERLEEGLIYLEGYYVETLHLRAFCYEKLALHDTVLSKEINAKIAKMALRYGLYRKYLSVRKTTTAHYLTDAALPMLIPYNKDAVNDTYTSLIEAGVATDGSHIEGIIQYRYCLVFVPYEALSNLAHVELIQTAAEERRLLVFNAPSTGPCEQGYMLEESFHPTYAAMDRFWKFIEDNAILDPNELPRGQVNKNLKKASELYQKLKKYIPLSVRPIIIRAGLKMFG